ncbi:hypothetical protein Cpir12675_000305 [Ceratocystis pirilliformis]|uniref:Major facilitator superfamily (MFS) profile domain-containing protein n=1 Tax=Ceratocystis pirilliformis TaxID=259994 RepID=A0ABR3ZLN0_9PEZI
MVSSERSPLLGAALRQPETNLPRPQRLFIVGLCCLFMLITMADLTIMSTSLVQAQEEFLCNAILATGRVVHCKDQAVQDELSIIQSWTVVFSLVPCLVMSVPCGLAADRYGRNLVLGTSLLGVTLCAFPEVFNLRMIWICSLFGFLGGGIAMFPTMLYTIVADVCGPDERSTTFSYLGASLMGGSLIGGGIAFYLVRIGTWISIYTGISIMAMLSIFGYCMPETRLPEDMPSRPLAKHSQPPTTTHWQDFLASAKADLQRCREFLHLLATRERQVGLMLVSTVLVTFGDSQVVLLQFVTNKFEWSWGKAGLLVSVQSACSLTLLLMVLPMATNMLLQIVGPRTKDLILARVSIVFKIIGICVVARASHSVFLFGGVALSACGFGYSIFVRGLMTSMVPHNNAVLYSVIGFLESIGILLASPVMGALYRLGLKRGGPWIGLPFLLAAGLYVGALIIVSNIGVDEEAEETEAEDEICEIQV